MTITRKLSVGTALVVTLALIVIGSAHAGVLVF
jgi:hypothetical protein